MSVQMDQLKKAIVFAMLPAMVIAALPTSLGAQAPAGPAAAPQVVAPAGPAYPKVTLTAGRSTVLATEFDVSRIAVTNPTIADAVVVRPREILIDGKSPGTISLIVWGTEARTQFDIVVEQAISTLEQQLHLLFPGEAIQVSVSTDAIILSGTVSSTEVMLRAAEIARAAASKLSVINMLTVPGAAESQQVMLQVRFA